MRPHRLEFPYSVLCGSLPYRTQVPYLSPNFTECPHFSAILFPHCRRSKSNIIEARIWIKHIDRDFKDMNAVCRGPPS